jgi:hypothetical protein
MDPVPRDEAAQRYTVAEVDVDCPPWFSSRGTGVVITENRLVTAAHVVFCPDIPRVSLYLSINGRSYPAFVEKDEAVFGDGTDLARIELLGAYDRFDVHAVPPLLGVPGYDDVVCAQTVRGPVCGPISALHTFDAATIPGDSGAPVYDEQALIGVLHGGDGVQSTWTPMETSMLEGT